MAQGLGRQAEISTRVDARRDIRTRGRLITKNMAYPEENAKWTLWWAVMVPRMLTDYYGTCWDKYFDELESHTWRDRRVRKEGGGGGFGVKPSPLHFLLRVCFWVLILNFLFLKFPMDDLKKMTLHPPPPPTERNVDRSNFQFSGPQTKICPLILLGPSVLERYL